ncbi:hypothetical protein EV181_007081, partial [Coemansia sp. RSA 532]
HYVMGNPHEAGMADGPATQSSSSLEAQPQGYVMDPEFAGTANATLTGVKKKLVTDWRRFDKILISVGIFFINFITALDSSSTGTIQPRVLSEFNAMTRAGVIST